jgi:hypothetical protein
MSRARAQRLRAIRTRRRSSAPAPAYGLFAAVKAVPRDAQTDNSLFEAGRHYKSSG